MDSDRRGHSRALGGGVVMGRYRTICATFVAVLFVAQALDLAYSDDVSILATYGIGFFAAKIDTERQKRLAAKG